jgi:hypothetical protein
MARTRLPRVVEDERDAPASRKPQGYLPPMGWSPACLPGGRALDFDKQTRMPRDQGKAASFVLVILVFERRCECPPNASSLDHVQC